MLGVSVLTTQNTMLIDTHEPDNIERLISQSLRTSRGPLNASGLSDYGWHTYLASLEQCERKQVPEIIGALPETEYQIGNQLATAPDSLINQYLIVEGIAQAIPEGIQTWKMHDNDRYYRKSTRFKLSMPAYEAYLIGLSRAGIVVIKTESWQDTAITLVALEKSAQYEGNTFHRHLKIRPSFRPDPYVEQLMGIKDIGPETAVQLIKVFGTPWKVYGLHPQVIADYVPGMGLAGAKDMLKRVGREDV